MADTDLNLSVGTVTRDAPRHVGATGPGKEWTTPALTNDGSDATYDYILSNASAYTDYIKSDLGAAYRVSAFNILCGNTPALITDFQYSTDGSTWSSLTGTETGSRLASPTGATFTFTAPIDARYWAIQSNAAGTHTTLALKRWEILGSSIPSAMGAEFSATPLTGTATLAVVFTDASTGTPNVWSWTFGDGGTSTSQNPTRNYTVAGTYTVVLQVTRTSDSATDTETKVGYVVVSPGPTPGVWVDWARDGFDEDAVGSDRRLARMMPQRRTVDDEITADVHSIDWAYGGSADHVSAPNPGTMTLTVQNSDGKYNPDNTASILYGFLKPGRPVWFGLNADGTSQGTGQTVYGVFAGYIREIVPLVEGGATALAEIICEDPMGSYSRRPVRVEASTSHSYGTLRLAVLSDIDESRHDLASEVDTMPIAAADSLNALSVLGEIDKATGSRSWANVADTKEDWYDYKVVTRHHKLQSAVDASINADDVQAITGYRVTADNVINYQQADVTPARLQPGSETVWTYADNNFPLSSKRTIWAQFDDYVQDAVIDYSSSGGAITSILTNFGTTAKIELWSASTSEVYNLTVEGRMVQRDAEEAVTAENVSSQVAYEKRAGATITSTYSSTAALAQGVADFAVWKFSQPLKRPAITQINEFSAILPRNMYDVIALTIDRLSVVARRFEIVGISGRYEPGPLLSVTWELQETPNQTALDLFTVGTDVLNGPALLGV